MIILGIDPGATGALVWLDAGSKKILACVDNARWNIAGRAGNLCNELEMRVQPAPGLVILEKQHARPAKDPETGKSQGIVSAWNYAEHYGLIQGVLGAFGFAPILADPGAWKGAMGLSRDKGASRRRAALEWPSSADLFKRVKDDGRAEAALLALWGVRFLPLPTKKEFVL